MTLIIYDKCLKLINIEPQNINATNDEIILSTKWNNPV